MGKEMRDIFEEIFRLGMFDCIRIIDTKTKTMEKEYVRKTEPRIPEFNFSQHELEYLECRQMQTTVQFLREHLDKTFLVFISALDPSDGRYISECFVEVDKKNFSVQKVVMDVDRLENAYKISVTDELTGTYNRRYFNKMISIALSNTEKKNQCFSLIFVDLDSFKEINDIYGHQVGDKMLKEMAQILLSIVREPLDYVSRYGGDEFIVCIQNKNYQEAEVIAEKIRKRIEEYPFEDESGNRISMTCSIGLYTVDSEKANYEEAMRSLDERLYCAKRTGKNKVVGEMSCGN